MGDITNNTIEVLKYTGDQEERAKSLDALPSPVSILGAERSVVVRNLCSCVATV